MSARFSQACENNKLPIVEQLKVHFSNASKVLEIGSGTGQHAAFFGPSLDHLVWQTSDLVENHSSISAWIEGSRSENVRPPVRFEIGLDEWPSDDFDAVFTANTAHIMQHNEVRLMMATIASSLPANGVFCQYGPFMFDGEFTSESNRDFDQSLRIQGYGGIVDVGQLKQWAKPLTLSQCVAMPANNHLLVWNKADNI